MSKPQKQKKQLTPEELKAQEQKQTRNGEIVCAVMMMSLGIITSPKLMSFFFQQQRYPQDYQPPSLMTFFALASGFVFFLTLLTICCRFVTKKPLPAEVQDPPSVKSVNQALKNTIIYTAIFLGLYNYLLQNWKENLFILQISPFVLFGTFILEFVLRIFEFAVGAKGFRYLAHAVTLFLLGVLTMECLSVGGSQQIEVK